ncbi:hypothetical protein QR680_005322 [Steinernema hermaphroditum]|uniref:Phosphatidic acid phosphatase type 2/haloperoxidase domain-containing protein n=1 Tax=Steinernema hermaphroditum TaxID=289476 RepID=A0AA39HT05_9BILA|nr:hypothetical protein QR680_005322 [Steinernema hermaphroditum]
MGLQRIQDLSTQNDSHRTLYFTEKSSRILTLDSRTPPVPTDPNRAHYTLSFATTLPPQLAKLIVPSNSQPGPKEAKPMASTPIKFPLVRWTIAVVALGVAVLLSYLIPKVTGPVKRGFFCDDESIRYPFKGNTVDPVLLGCVCYFVVILTIIATELLYNRLCLYAGTYAAGQIPNYRIGSLQIPYVLVRMFFAFAISQVGLAVGIILMNMTKYSVGRLRPHFISACQPHITNAALGNITVDHCGDKHIYILDTDFKCTQEDEKILTDARLSFFSGHTSNAFYFALYCVLFVHLRLGHQFFDIIVFPLYYALLICAAAFVGYSRIFDYKHHWSDVMTGAIVGCFLAVITVVYFRKLLVVPPIRPELRARVQFVNEDEASATVDVESGQRTEQV